MYNVSFKITQVNFVPDSLSSFLSILPVMTTISGLFVSLDFNDSLNLQASKTAKDSRQTYSQKPYLAHAGGVILEGAHCLQ